MPQSVIKEVSNYLSSVHASSYDGKVPETIIKNLLTEKLGNLDESDIFCLDILTRKIDIARRVSKEYSLDWKSLINNAPVSCDVLLGIALCLTLAEFPPDEDNRGRNLKWLNAAFNAVHLAKRSPGVSEDRIKQVLALINRKFLNLVET